MEQSTKKKKKLNKNQWLHDLTKEQRNKHFIYENYEQKPWTGGKNAESLTEHKLKRSSHSPTFYLISLPQTLIEAEVLKEN